MYMCVFLHIRIIFEQHAQTAKTEYTRNIDVLTEIKRLSQVDFGAHPAARMLKPRNVKIRRRFEDGVWLRLGSSAHQLLFHMKIHRLQVGVG